MKKLKQSRTASFVVIFVVYVIAVAIGVLSYGALDAEWWLKLLFADVVATIVTFVFSLIFNNASVYDPYWSVQPMVIVTAFILGKKLSIGAILVLIAIFLWGVRLTLNWAYTFLGLNYQDWRYTMLKEKTKAFYPIINFVGIHMVPTLVVYFCVLPAVALIRQNPTFNPLCLIGFVVCIVAVVLQLLADWQMQKFRKSKVGGFIRVGLWKYSRHPNYFGEILMWWGVGIIFVTHCPSQWYLLLGALLNTLLFAFVSIPMAEQKQAKKPNFVEYKNQTRLLLPIKKQKPQV